VIAEIAVGAEIERGLRQITAIPAMAAISAIMFTSANG